MRYALVNADGLVVNAIVWDGQADYTPADGLTLVEVPDGKSCGPGWTFDGIDWIAPPFIDEEIY